jgi:hypothetical protein
MIDVEVGASDGGNEELMNCGAHAGGNWNRRPPQGRHSTVHSFAGAFRGVTKNNPFNQYTVFFSES